MKSPRKSAALASLGALLTVLLMACGDDGDDSPAEEIAGGAAEIDASAGPSDADNEKVATVGECNPPDGLLGKVAVQRQLLLNVALARGENFEAIQSENPLDPETFRSVADVLDNLDLAGVPSYPQFDGAEEVVADLRKTADLLQAVLEAGTDTADPAWQELSQFYTLDFFVQHSASLDYYLNEAGCV